ncbi:chromosome partitioning protein ParA [Vibrio sp. Isolate31]|uniref:chromosome partitioning protein ParA n=1 Tax=unclassified Vibrio TaxID=2614977 RepID=UPI001EFC8239|nr:MULTISPECIES: chromosome partitioning protein ParA [unclassified Vibrio]MCG9554454.1 chromosome partitioning protein ParA [Vibrio sp. Isolate32]MCG9600669.1 chromosome partitioning protein ParA [Vibrio sp. Isolate31]
MAISAIQAEMEQLYLTSELNGQKSICVTACHSGDGVTSVATALAERFLLAGHSALYVDLNLYNPAFKDLNMLEDNQQGQLIEHVESKRLFIGVPAPQVASTQLAYKDPATLQNIVHKWLEKYDRVIIDTSPLLHTNKRNVPAQSVASGCDSTLLVVAYGETSSHHLEQAKKLLDAQSINLMGCVMNMKQTPSFAQELIRQLNRLKFIPSKWRDSLAKKLYQNEFLNLPM